MRGLSNPKGNYFVQPTPTACARAWELCGNKMREYQKLRRHAFKLAYWPTGVEEDGFGADIDWDWIRGLRGERVGELRIDENINGTENVRVIFFKANKLIHGETMPRIWLLTVFAKKRNEFTKPELKAFAAMKAIVVHRNYTGIVDA